MPYIPNIIMMKYWRQPKYTIEELLLSNGKAIKYAFFKMMVTKSKEYHENTHFKIEF